MVDWDAREAYESDVRGYFLCCPLCGSRKISVHMTEGGRDTLSCEGCGAKWHLYIGVTGLKWAELDLPSENGKGNELLGKRLKKEYWAKLCQDVRKTIREPKESTTSTNSKNSQEIIVKEKETIIKEIVMISCKYCGSLMPQTSIFCPNCGAKRSI